MLLMQLLQGGSQRAQSQAILNGNCDHPEFGNVMGVAVLVVEEDLS
jgi:hypothetical protein